MLIKEFGTMTVADFANVCLHSHVIFSLHAIKLLFILEHFHDVLIHKCFKGINEFMTDFLCMFISCYWHI